MSTAAAIVDLRLYPFLADAGEVAYRRYGLDLAKLAEIKNDFLDLARSRVEKIIKSGHSTKPLEQPDEEILVFHYAAAMVAAIRDKWLSSRFALAEADRAYNGLKDERDEVLAHIARLVGISTLQYRKGLYKSPIGLVRGIIVYDIYDYSVRFAEYVTFARRLIGDPAWKPVNLPVLRGYVFLKKDQVARLAKEAITLYIENYVANIASKTAYQIKEKIREHIDALRKVLAERYKPRIDSKGAISIPRGVVMEEAFPPCISDLVERARRGENLSHHERFALATFMLNIGADIETVVDLFRNMPDFNEKITRYQVEHLAGLRGSGKKYLVYSCEKMKTLGICKAECGTRSPLQAYYKNLKKIYRLSKNKSRNK
ncbi:DNA primase regulatory subunit PriL [Pyrofollis japonicus]|uniref:hypothetical protein n=1 Tax=Pyrofollis japonicus TaxID=3060460 RepID=UPI00295C1755|nr:hypothetical protein [Pyrofollis japonicus]BEP17679.1 DNA primase regulatory subunit PriL [Pyrofollis japonicus]